MKDEGSGELKSHTVLAEDLSLVLSTLGKQCTIIYNYSFQGFNILLWLLWAPVSCTNHHTHTHTF